MPNDGCQKPSRRWRQFPLASLFALLVIAAIAFAWVGRQMRPPVVLAEILAGQVVELRLRPGNDVVRASSRAELTAELRKLKQALDERGVAPQATHVQITVADEAPCRLLKQLMLASFDAGMTEFELKLDSAKVARVSLARLNDASECGLPPIRVRLRANTAGDLTAVLLGDRPITLAGLRREVHTIVGPGSDDFPFEVVLEPDDALRFHHLRAAWEQVGWRVESSGQHVVLVDCVFPFDARRELEVSDVMEE